MSKQGQRQRKELKINEKTAENGKIIKLLFEIYLEDFPIYYIYTSCFKIDLKVCVKEIHLHKFI